MKKYRVCMESYISNNIDCTQCDVYFTYANSLEEAKEYAQKCAKNWQKINKGIMYNVFDVMEVKQRKN